MLIHGEKYACEACVRGHRVSNCNHYERPLTHINKKGRPVSQCQHCRGLRKARSSHVKCECGNKGPKDKPKCCGCGNGGRCTCALKKDHLNPVVNNGATALSRSRSQTESRKPPLTSNHSDSSMTQFTNGHHAPVHRRNHAGAECGRPYRVNRPHSIHGGHSLAQRSTDNLSVPSTPDFQADYFHGERFAMSEHGSPGTPPFTDGLLNGLPTLDNNNYTGLGIPVSMAPSPVISDFPASFPPFDYPEQQQPVPSGLGMEPIDWSSMGLDNALSDNYNQAASYTSFDQPPTSHPALTSASSTGSVSEHEDFNLAMHSPAPGQSPYGQFDEQTGVGNYNMSTDSLRSMTPPLGTSNPIDNLSMEQFIRANTPQSPVPFDDFRSGSPIDQGNFAPRFTPDGLKPMHPCLAEARGPSPPIARPMPTSDPSWANSYPGEEPTFNMGPGMQQEPVWTS